MPSPWGGTPTTYSPIRRTVIRVAARGDRAQCTPGTAALVTRGGLRTDCMAVGRNEVTAQACVRGTASAQAGQTALVLASCSLQDVSAPATAVRRTAAENNGIARGGGHAKMLTVRRRGD